MTPSFLFQRAAVEAPKRRLRMHSDTLVALLSLYWALMANRALLGAAHGVGLSPVVMVLMLALLHFLLLAPLMHRHWARLTLAVLAGVVAACAPFAQRYGTAFDPGMLRNALRTDWPEARELLTGGVLLSMVVLAVPAWVLISQVQLRSGSSRWRSVAARALRWGLALLAFGALLATQYQGLSSLMRQQKALRYQIVPAAPLWSAGKALLASPPRPAGAREPIGQDAQPGASWATAGRPRLMVLVVGETVRAANWGRHGDRNTTPALDAQTDLLRWPVVRSCGTDTETSLPCMFAPVGRRDYDEGRIRREQSLLHVLNRAGVKVEWVDNQSGCKGVCDGLPTTQLQCNGGRCLDDALFERLGEALARAEREGGVHLLVLHMLGNHGPAYHRRVPEGYAPYQPACPHDELSRCKSDEIRNAYDNALRHTDRLLADAWSRLRQSQSSVDTAMLFIPDHGESLGEHGLYLHGIPYAIAPQEQKEVPMVLGLSPNWASARGWSPACLREMSQRRDVQHDHLFHTVLSLLDVRTTLHAPEWDLLTPCQS